MEEKTSNTPPIKQSVWYKKIPTLLTISNSLCGFSAILYCLQVYEKEKLFEPKYIFAHCAWLIIGAMIFDALDGWSARKLKASSLHGLEMDSLADMVTFGVAPAVVVCINAQFTAHTNQLYVFDGFLRYDRLVWIASAIYLACAATRLALYNVYAHTNASSDNFRGIPSPGAAGGVCSILILYTSDKFIFPLETITVALPIYAAFLGYLMVCSIPYPHMTKWLLGKEKRLRKLIVLGVVLVTLVFEPKLTAFLAINLYVCSGPLVLILNKITGKKVGEETELEDLVK